jgi:ankyrin repeat protein
MIRKRNTMKLLTKILLISGILTSFAFADTISFKTIDEAIARGTAEDVRSFIKLHPENLQKGARETSRTPLEQAVLRNKPETAIALLDAGANPNVADASMRTPLHIAVERNNPQILTALLKAKADPNLGDKAGWTPLHHAAAKNQPKSANILLKGGADPTLLSKLGGTPLHEAAASGGPEIINMRLATKIDHALKSKQDVTALDIAKEYKNEPAIELLEAVK